MVPKTACAGSWCSPESSGSKTLGTWAGDRCVAERIASYVSTDGSARACGVGACACKVTTSTDLREASGPRIDRIPPTRPPWWDRQNRDIAMLPELVHSLFIHRGVRRFRHGFRRGGAILFSDRRPDVIARSEGWLIAMLNLGDETRDARGRPLEEEIERTARRGKGGAHTARVDIEGDLQTPRPRDAVGEPRANARPATTSSSSYAPQQN